MHTVPLTVPGLMRGEWEDMPEVGPEGELIHGVCELGSMRSREQTRRAVMKLIFSGREGVKGLDLLEIMTRFDVLTFRSLYLNEYDLKDSRSPFDRNAPLAPHRDLTPIKSESGDRLYTQLFYSPGEISGPPTLIWKAKDVLRKMIGMVEERLLKPDCDDGEREIIHHYTNPLKPHLDTWQHGPSSDWEFNFNRALEYFESHAFAPNREVTNARIARLRREIDCVQLARHEPFTLDVVNENTVLHGRPSRGPEEPPAKGKLKIVGTQ